MLEDKRKTHGGQSFIVGLFRQAIAHQKVAILADVNCKPFSCPPKLIGFVDNRRGCLPEILIVSPDGFVFENLVYYYPADLGHFYMKHAGG